MDNRTFQELQRCYEPVITNIIASNIKFYRFDKTINWQFCYNEQGAIFASYDNKRDLVEFMYIGSAPISINAYAAFMFIKDILELKKHYNNTGRTYQMPIVVYDKNSKYNIKDWFIAEI